MEREYTKDKNEKQAKSNIPVKDMPKNEAKQEAKVEEKKEEGKVETSAETKTEVKKEEKKKDEKKPVIKKDKAVVNGTNLPISKKHSMAICDMIRGKSIEPMIAHMEQTIKLRKPIKMKGEIPHRKGNMMSGRYPVNACKEFISLLKQLGANSSVNGIENPVITKAVANDAARPFRRGGSMRFKRTNVVLETRERIMKQENKKENKQEVKAEEKK
jgi:ribosomal protein L22